MNFAKSIIGASAIAVLASVASADVLTPGSDKFTAEGSVQGWNVYADHERNSCLVEHVDPSGNVVQMGLTENKDMGYIGVFTKKDVGLSAVGKEMTILVNGNAYSGKSHTRKHGLADGYQGGYMLANNPNFVNDIKNGMELIAFPDTHGVGVIVSLKGSHAAIEAAAACTAKMGS